MDTLAGMEIKGRRIAEPASELLELESEEGLRFRAIVFGEPFREHRSLLTAVDLALPFMQFPMVAGLVELTERLPTEGAFIYRTGGGWTIAEALVGLRDKRTNAGVRAGLEMSFLCAGILLEASETGAQLGVDSHLSLTPQRIMLKSDGQVQIIGYGLTQVEMLDFLDNGGKSPAEDSFRYCPPERLAGDVEDLNADFYSLCLIAFEFITGKPLLDGSLKELEKGAREGAAASNIGKQGASLPKGVKSFFATALNTDPSKRFSAGFEFLQALEELLGSKEIKGKALAEVVSDIYKVPLRGGRSLQSVEETGRSLPKPAAERLKIPARVKLSAADAEEEEQEAAPAQEQSARDKAKDRLRGRRPPSRGRGTKAATKTDEPSDAKAAAKDRLKSRRPPSQRKPPSKKTAEPDTTVALLKKDKDAAKERLKSTKPPSKSPAEAKPSTESAKKKARANLKGGRPPSEKPAAKSAKADDGNGVSQEAPAKATPKTKVSGEVEAKQSARDRLKGRRPPSTAKEASKPEATGASPAKGKPSAGEKSASSDSKSAARDRLKSRRPPSRSKA